MAGVGGASLVSRSSSESSSSESESSTRKGSGTAGSACSDGTAGSSGLPDDTGEASLSVSCDSLFWERVCSLDSASSTVVDKVDDSVVTPDEPEVDFSILGLRKKDASLLPDLGDAGNVNGGAANPPTTGRRRRGEMVVLMTLAFTVELTSTGGCAPCDFFLQLRTNFLNFLMAGICILALDDLDGVDIVSLSGLQLMLTPCLNTP